jgi:hypothetical protein
MHGVKNEWLWSSSETLVQGKIRAKSQRRVTAFTNTLVMAMRVGKAHHHQSLIIKRHIPAYAESHIKQA